MKMAPPTRITEQKLEYEKYLKLGLMFFSLPKNKTSVTIKYGKDKEPI